MIMTMMTMIMMTMTMTIMIMTMTMKTMSMMMMTIDHPLDCRDDVAIPEKKESTRLSEAFRFF